MVHVSHEVCSKVMNLRTRLPLTNVDQGTIFRANDLVESGHMVLVKTIGQSRLNGPLHQECSVLSQLHGIHGIPDIVWSGAESGVEVIAFEDWAQC